MKPRNLRISPTFAIHTEHNIPLFPFQEVLSEASRALFYAVGEKAFFKQVTVVVPRQWRQSKCQVIINCQFLKKVRVLNSFSFTGIDPRGQRQQHIFGDGHGGHWLPRSRSRHHALHAAEQRLRTEGRLNLVPPHFLLGPGKRHKVRIPFEKCVV